MNKTKPISNMVLIVIAALILVMQPNNGNADPTAFGMLTKEVAERLFKMAMHDIMVYEELKSQNMATGPFYIDEAYRKTRAEIEENYNNAVDRINEKYSNLNDFERNSPEWKKILNKATRELNKAKKLYQSHLRAIEEQKATALRTLIPIWKKNKLPNNDNML